MIGLADQWEVLPLPLDIEKQNLTAELNKFCFLTDRCEVIVIVIDIMCYLYEHNVDREHCLHSKN